MRSRGGRRLGFFEAALTANASPGEADLDVRKRAGELAVGVWLPLALADILGWIAYGASWGEKEIDRATAVRSWGLTDLAQAVENDLARAKEKEENDELMASFERFAKLAAKRKR